MSPTRASSFGVPESVSDRAAVLLEPFATALSPLLAAPPDEGAKVLIIGAGSIGLLMLAAVRAVARTAEVTILARYDFQAEHAERLRAQHIVRPKGSADYFAELARLSEGKLLQPVLGKRIGIGGFDATFVCAGSDAAVDDALRFTRSGGAIHLLGNVSSLKKVDWTPIWLKELTVRGSLCYGFHQHGGAERHSFDVGLDFLAGGLAADLEPLVSHTFPLTDYKHALATAMGKSKSPSVKVAFAV